jgi:G3E family GTPase
MERIAVHIVTGAPGSGKSALIARLCSERGDWLGLVNTLPQVGRGLRQLSAGCPCCTGKVVLQVSLARGLRETGARRALVELADPEHAATLEKLLTELPLSLAVIGARRILMPAETGLKAAELDA